MFHLNNGHSIILASESTRRVDLLRTLGIPFSIIPPSINEERKKGETPKDYVRRISMEKAMTIAKFFPDKWVIGADTVVVHKNRLIGKPENEEDAYRTLKMLKGKWHKVITGFSIVNIEKNVYHTDSVETKVFLKDLSDEEIVRYIKTCEPFGKAGSYAIQGKGGFMVKEIRGSYANVVGLPICELVEALQSLGIVS
ncbi:MAG: Maf family protein [Desulfobacterota bacterium]|nr:Maf family protein [Thermodesulfobacteriota bacterium]MDW8001245.1 Maf family protein [Deltaproteobacteria bacterium]